MKKKQFAVLGIGNFGSSVANSLAGAGYDVLAVDSDEERLSRLSTDVAQSVIGDVTNEAFLKSLGIRNFDVAIVAIGEDLQSSILTTIILKEEGVPYIVAKAMTELHEKVLRKVGATRVVFPEKDMGQRIAYSLTATKVLDFLELSETDSIMEIIAPQAWIGKSLRESKIREKFDVSIIAIKNDNSIISSPHADYVIKKEDLLIIIGSNENISKVKEFK